MRRGSPRLQADRPAIRHGRAKMNFASFYLLFVLFFAQAVPASAASPVASVNASKPHVLVVVADDLTWTDIRAAVNRMPYAFSIALMSPGRPVGTDPVASAYATLGAGDSIAAGEVSEGLLCRALHDAARRVALIGNADGDDTGDYRPATHFIPEPDDLPSDDGTIADPLAPGGRRMDPGRLTAATMHALAVDDLVVVDDGDFDRLEREAHAGWLAPSAYRAHHRDVVAAFTLYLKDIGEVLGSQEMPTRLFVVGAAPAPAWDRLTPVVIGDFGVSALGYPLLTDIATSDTTRTPGLIAARDIASSILATLGVPSPIQMTGAVVRSYGHATQVTRILDRLDRITTLDQQVATPFFWVLGFAGGFTVLASLLVVSFGSGRNSLPLILYGLRVFAGWPLALLIAPLFEPSSIGAYLGWICLIWLAIGLLPSPQAILFMTAMVIVIDAFLGSTLVAASLLSAYRMSGIRFYGIGNEYMGVLIGGALMAPILYADRKHGATHPGSYLAAPPEAGREGEQRPHAPVSGGSAPCGGVGRARRTMSPDVVVKPLLLALWFAIVIFVLSFPAFGAKAGGAVTALSTFLFAWWQIRRETIGLSRVVGAISAGFALVFVWAFLDRRLGLSPTHIDTAVTALSSGRFGYIVGVASRKVALALRVGLHPGTILGILGLLLLCAVVRALLGSRLRALWRMRPVYAAVTVAGLRGCVVALLFNDSGIIAAILLFISLMLPNLYALFTLSERKGEYRLTTNQES